MFTGLLRDMNKGLGGILDTFIVYLERHIEVDGKDIVAIKPRFFYEAQMSNHFV